MVEYQVIDLDNLDYSRVKSIPKINPNKVIVTAQSINKNYIIFLNLVEWLYRNRLRVIVKLKHMDFSLLKLTRFREALSKIHGLYINEKEMDIEQLLKSYEKVMDANMQELILLLNKI